MTAQGLPDALPAVREDLQLQAQNANPDGSPAWTLLDPVSNAFYKIGWLEFELLSRWHLGDPQSVLKATAEQTLLQPTEDELLATLQFLQQHHLLEIRTPAFTETLIAQYRRSRLSKLQWLLHHYLFFRIPLWHPDRWLQRTLPWIAWLYTPAMAWCLLGASLTGVVLAARQFDVFAASWVETLSPGGFAGYVVALTLSKSLHELGHALTATRYRVRVAHMGVAFLVMWPVLYTDTSESWKLTQRRQRLAIASAGIITELALAGLATLAWALTEPGDMRQAFFFLASAAWLISLGLNVSPFMRFDGYFILSDLLDFHNLHERSSALARTWLRRHLLGWNDAYDEHFAPRQHAALIAFALVTWVYRLTVFLGIAFAVYFLFFKLLGILLFLVEMAWFVVRPFVQEFKVWTARSSEILPGRKRLAGVAGVLALAVALIPWGVSVEAAGFAHSQQMHALYSPTPARLVTLPAGEAPVAQHALLFALEQPESAMRMQLAQAGAAALDGQLAGLGAVPDGEERRMTLLQQRNLRQSQSNAEADEAVRLQLTSPIAGTLTDIDPELVPGTWVNPRQPLGMVINPNSWSVEALIGQHDLQRVRVGNQARFYMAAAPLHMIRGVVTDIDSNKLTALPHALMSSRFGGPVPVLSDSAGLSPRDALYRVRIRLNEPPPHLHVQRGTVQIDAAAHSWLLDLLTAAAAVLVRELSF